MATGFVPRGQVIGEQSPGVVSLIIKASETIYVGGAVTMTSGFVAAASTTGKVLGICLGIVTNNGINLDNATTDDYDGTWTEGGFGTGNYVATSDNQTDKKVRALVCIDKNAMYYNDTASTLTTAHLFGFLNTTSATQLAAFVTGQVAGQFQIVKLDPDGDADASKCIVKLAESQLDPYSQS